MMKKLCLCMYHHLPFSLQGGLYLGQSVEGESTLDCPSRSSVTFKKTLEQVSQALGPGLLSATGNGMTCPISDAARMGFLG